MGQPQVDHVLTLHCVILSRQPAVRRNQFPSEDDLSLLWRADVILWLVWPHFKLKVKDIEDFIAKALIIWSNIMLHVIGISYHVQHNVAQSTILYLRQFVFVFGLSYWESNQWHWCHQSTWGLPMRSTSVRSTIHSWQTKTLPLICLVRTKFLQNIACKKIDSWGKNFWRAKVVW